MNHDKEQVLPAAAGLWENILQNLAGLDSSIFRGKHSPCPLCGGNDRFRYVKGYDQPFLCSQCGTRSPVNFYMELTGIDFSTAINDIGDFLNLIPIEQREQINKETIASSSFPSWYKFNFDLYQQIKNESEFKLSPWQRVNYLNMLDLLAHGDCTLVWLLDKSGVKSDYVMIDVDGNIKTTSDNTIIPFGFYSVFGEELGKCIYLTIKPLVAANFALFTGKQAVCCYSLENMESVLNNFGENACVAIVSDITETNESDELQLAQLIFNSKTRKVAKKIWQPGEIINSKGK